MKILIISEYIAPVQEIASKRWSKIVKYIKKNHKVEVDVLTLERNYDDKESIIPVSRKDPLLFEEEKLFSQYYYVKYESVWKKYLAFRRRRNAKEDIIETGDLVPKKDSKRAQIYVITYLKQLFADVLQNRLAKSAYKEIKSRIKEYDVVISSYGPLWVHIVAQKLKKENPNIKWIADFRDPCAKEIELPLIFRFHKNFVHKKCKSADMITKVANSVELYQDRSQKVCTITNGYDVDEAITSIAPRNFNIVYTGTIYEDKMDVSVMAKVITELIEEGIIDYNDVIYQYAGKEGGCFEYQIRKNDSLCKVELLGVIPRDEAIKLQGSAAVLLQASWNTKKEKLEWSGKMFEYMMTKKPIVFCVTGDEPFCYPSRNIHKLGGICYEACRDTECFPILKEYVQKKYIEWKNTGNVTVSIDEEYVNSYSYQSVSEEVWSLICKVI